MRSVLVGIAADEKFAGAPALDCAAEEETALDCLFAGCLGEATKQIAVAHGELRAAHLRYYLDPSAFAHMRGELNEPGQIPSLGGRQILNRSGLRVR